MCVCGCGYVFVRLSFHFDGNSSPTKGSESIHFFYAEIALHRVHRFMRTNVLTYVLALSFRFHPIPCHSTASHTAKQHTLYTLERFSHLFVHSHLVFCEMYKWHGTNNVSLWLLVSSFSWLSFALFRYVWLFSFLFYSLLCVCVRPFETAAAAASPCSTFFQLPVLFTMPTLFMFFLSCCLFFVGFFFAWLSLPFVC